MFNVRHEHDSPFDVAQGGELVEPRARITEMMKAGISTSLQVFVVLAAIIVPNLAWSHDQSAAQKARGTERREVRIPIEDFTLTDQTSRPFKFQSLRGKVAIIAFAYTTCPDVCPLITAAMRQAQESLTKDERALTYFVTITTDPEIDTPQVMAAYAKRYGVDTTTWGFLTGDEAVLEKDLEELRRRCSEKSTRSHRSHNINRAGRPQRDYAYRLYRHVTRPQSDSARCAKASPRKID